jgi:hypothetical protein
VRAHESGRNSVVFMSTMKNIYGLSLSNLLSDSFSFKIFEIYQSAKTERLSTSDILVETQQKSKTSKSLKLYFETMKLDQSD